MSDPALRNIGQRKGIEVWRIKDFKLEKVPHAKHGNFYTGDSYIVLSTVDPNENKYDVHFWLGKETSVDERGTAAIKTVELDDALQGHPVQYREVQDHESATFISYFKNGIKYLKGGAASGFNHVTEENFDDWTPALFQCKGKRNVRCTQVECSRESLNIGDVFILDCGNDLYVWMPPDCGRLERIKGMRQAQNIRDEERCGNPNLHCVDEDWDTNEEFWSRLGGCDDLGDLNSPQEGGGDADFWQSHKKELVLLKVSDADGDIDTTVVSEGTFESSQLDSQEAFILNTGSGGVFVWVGKRCSEEERRQSMKIAKSYLDKEGLPEWTQVVRVFEDNEPFAFMQWASAWEKESIRSPVSHTKLIQCNDARGKFIGEEVANFTQEDLDGDDIMLLYTTDKIYVWIGAQATDEERCQSSYMAKKYVEMNNIPRIHDSDIETVDQGSEPADFKNRFPSWNSALFRSAPRSWK